MGNEKIVLIVDDEEDLRDTVGYKFQSHGYQVETAVDGIDALEMLETLTPDLIILDMNMPRMNGLEFYEKIKGENAKPKYPVLILTARANMEQLFADLDVDGFMSKPFELNEVFREGNAIIKKDSGAILLGRDADDKRARTVCIVENNENILNELAIAFLAAGYIVNSAHSGAASTKRVSMDVPDLAVVSLGLNDISGDVVIGKLKRLEGAEKMKFILYTASSGDNASVSSGISHKEGIDKFVEYISASSIIDVAGHVFKE